MNAVEMAAENFVRAQAEYFDHTEGFASRLAFPELQLADYASTYRESWPQLANLCRNVLACYDALRERCLTAELERDQCEHAVRLHLDPELWPAILGEQSAD